MKKFITVLVIIFISSNAHASCYDDIEWSWEFSGAISARFEFLNNGSKDVVIKKLRIYKEEILLKEKELVDTLTLKSPIISKFGKRTFIMQVGEFQRRFITGANFICSY